MNNHNKCEPKTLATAEGISSRDADAQGPKKTWIAPTRSAIPANTTKTGVTPGEEENQEYSLS